MSEELEREQRITLGLSSGGVKAFPFLGFRPLLLREDRRNARMARHQAPCRALIHLPGNCRHQSLAAPIIERSRRNVRRRGSTSLRGLTTLDKEERQKIIAIGKHPKEVGIEQASQEVLRSDVIAPSQWEFLEEVLAKARGMTRERLEIERERS
ncbi:hypothetical protein ACLOJK_001331 [Asimina triloba]